MGTTSIKARHSHLQRHLSELLDQAFGQAGDDEEDTAKERRSASRKAKK
jgi:hypothetical protein